MSEPYLTNVMESIYYMKDLKMHSATLYISTTPHSLHDGVIFVVSIVYLNFYLKDIWPKYKYPKSWFTLVIF